MSNVMQKDSDHSALLHYKSAYGLASRFAHLHLLVFYPVLYILYIAIHIYLN